MPITIRGNAYAGKGDFAQAIQDYDKAIELKPDAASFYNNRGRAYFDQGELVRAIQDYDQAIDLDPDHTLAYYNRGVMWLLPKEWTKARSDLTTAKERGVPIAEFFSSMFGSVSNFEQTFNVQLPDDIKEMLTP